MTRRTLRKFANKSFGLFDLVLAKSAAISSTPKSCALPMSSANSEQLLNNGSARLHCDLPEGQFLGPCRGAVDPLTRTHRRAADVLAVPRQPVAIWIAAATPL